jgi:hypothetical protein
MSSMHSNKSTIWDQLIALQTCPCWV